MTLSTRPCVSFASAASLKSDSLVAAPVRGMMLTSVGGSVKLWRRPTITGPLPAIASEPKLCSRVTGARRAAADVEAIDATRARVVDRAEQRARVGRPDQAFGGAVPVLGETADLAGAALVQHQPRAVGVEVLDRLAANASSRPSGLYSGAMSSAAIVGW